MATSGNSSVRGNPDNYRQIEEWGTAIATTSFRTMCVLGLLFSGSRCGPARLTTAVPRASRPQRRNGTARHFSIQPALHRAPDSMPTALLVIGQTRRRHASQSQDQ